MPPSSHLVFLVTSPSLRPSRGPSFPYFFHINSTKCGLKDLLKPLSENSMALRSSVPGICIFLNYIFHPNLPNSALCLPNWARPPAFFTGFPAPRASKNLGKRSYRKDRTLQSEPGCWICDFTGGTVPGDDQALWRCCGEDW